MVKSSLMYGLELTNPDYTHVLEFGVWTGHTLGIIRAANSRFKVFGFDSFEGLPEDWPGTDCIKGLFSTQGQAPCVPGTTIIPGWFTDTLPIYLGQADKIALLHLDCDLYSSTREVLEALNPYIVPTTMIVCDEWVYRLQAGGYGDDQEQKAVKEWCANFGRKLEHIPFDDYSNAGNEHRLFRVIE